VIRKLFRKICLLFYYSIGCNLPDSNFIFGKVWKYARYLLVKNIFESCGKNVNVENNAHFRSGKQITIGENSGIGAWAELYGKIKIGNDVMMASHVSIITKNHRFEKRDIPMWRQGFEDECEVIIEDDVWIGTYVVILPGVTIGKGSIIAAGSVVTRNIEPFSIVGGVPAKKIRMRN
jgi:maltose O-acetyltransferase